MTGAPPRVPGHVHQVFEDPRDALVVAVLGDQLRDVPLPDRRVGQPSPVAERRPDTPEGPVAGRGDLGRRGVLRTAVVLDEARDDQAAHEEAIEQEPVAAHRSVSRHERHLR